MRVSVTTYKSSLKSITLKTLSPIFLFHFSHLILSFPHIFLSFPHIFSQTILKMEKAQIAVAALELTDAALQIAVRSAIDRCSQRFRSPYRHDASDRSSRCFSSPLRCFRSPFTVFQKPRLPRCFRLSFVALQITVRDISEAQISETLQIVVRSASARR